VGSGIVDPITSPYPAAADREGSGMSVLQDWLETAHSLVPKVDRAEAERLMTAEDAVVVDVRDGTEVAATGKVAGAIHVPRGMIEFRADPLSPLHHDALRPDRAVILYCAAGFRAALAGKTLLDMGYQAVFNLGGLPEWIYDGGAVDMPLDAGM
jgi:rhodanese-related sulfurtransferase